MEDNIITEIRKIKDKLASEYDYDVRKILNDVIKRQRESGNRIVNLRKERLANQSMKRMH
ncbi:MAG: hypothetical protein HQK77_18000 [Desulfobacterales bacterium]|nr:hypothetical protein [Desulfobacterales bacterium]